FAPIPASFGRIDHRHAKRHEEIWLRHQGEGDGSASHLRHDGPVVGIIPAPGCTADSRSPGKAGPGAIQVLLSNGTPMARLRRRKSMPLFNLFRRAECNNSKRRGRAPLVLERLEERLNPSNLVVYVDDNWAGTA